jgi:BirA family biotin operon repressor/biotin-[acetyl-CoA-carboxylase] ligase
MPVGDIVHRLGTVPSTNDAARALACRGAAHGTAVLADAQTCGRGTKGRNWHSPAGLGLYASFILRGPGGGAVPFPHLVPLVGGLAALDALREAGGVEARLKWPNDIVHGDKKLGGVLSEGVSGSGGEGFVVVGIGLNIGHEAGDFPEDLRAGATSIRLAGGRDVPGEALFDALCRALDRWYNVLAGGDREAVVGSFASQTAIPPGARVIVRTADGAFEAEYRGLDLDGRLVVSRGGGGTTALDAVMKLERPA